MTNVSDRALLGTIRMKVIEAQLRLDEAVAILNNLNPTEPSDGAACTMDPMDGACDT